ncbi:MAG TPA: hypothetical protein VN599_07890 [Rudaea sp.]|nr:hypothetical protein [Rudaea sp.]
MTKHHRLVGLVFAAMAMCWGGVMANGVLTVTALADYNSAQVAQNSYIVTVPYGNVSYFTYYTLTSGTQLEAGSYLTVTLPTGFTFNTAPSLFFVGFSGGANSNLVSGGINFQFATFQISTAVTNVANPVYIYPNFAIRTPTSFASQFGGNSLSLSIQATGNATAANNDPSPVSQPAFNHAVGSLPDTITPGSGQINLANPYYGDQFVASGNTVADSGLVATFAINTETNDPFNGNVPVLSPSGAANSLAAGDTANITVYGYFNGIGLAYANANTSGNCQGSIPGGSGVYAGALTSASISFSGVPINTPVQICMIPYGVMWASNEPYVFTYSAGAGVTDFFGGLSQTTAGNFYTYQAQPTTVVSVLAGSPQKATVGSGFCTPLAVQVYDTSTTPSYPLQGIDVIFDAPTSGQSGTFTVTSNSYGNSSFIGTDSHGIATTGFTANSTAGVYTDTANVGTVQALFGLTNQPGTIDYIFCNGFEL